MAGLENLLTVKQAAKMLDKNPGTVRRWIKEKRLPATKISGKYGTFLIAKNDMLELMIKQVSKRSGK